MGVKGSFDWNDVLDIELAAKNVRTDIFGDWYRDPWDWPEIEWLSKPQGHKHVLQALNDEGSRRSVPVDVPKTNFATRPAMVFDPVDRLAYQSLVDRLSPKLIGQMPSWSYSWRLSRGKPKPGKYSDMRSEWPGYRHRLNGLSAVFDAALVTDIVSFFPSIPIARLIDDLHDVAGSSILVERLSGLLQSWDRISGRGGLPQRANASCVLASMYLRPVDDVLTMCGRSIASGGPYSDWRRLQDGTASRWVDDIWLFGSDRSELRAVQLDLQGAMLNLGLHINLAKTDVLEGDELIQKARQLEHSAVDMALLGQGPQRLGPLNDLIDDLLVRPEHANRTSVRFATVRMRKMAKYDRVADFVNAAQRMPQCAEALARLFRDSEKNRELHDWYCEYLTSHWSKINLAAAQLGMMFPSSIAPPRRVIDSLVARVQSSRSLPFLALVVQRLGAWERDRARTLVRRVAQGNLTPGLPQNGA